MSVFRAFKLALMTVTWLAFIWAAYFCFTGEPWSVHLWWDQGDPQCIRCKMCSGCTVINVGIHNQSYHHPKLYAAGFVFSGAVLGMALWFFGNRRRSLRLVNP
jgi:hypothetical protein